MVRGLFVALILLILPGCGRGDLSPSTESRTPPDLAGRFFPPSGWAWGWIQVGAQPAQRYGVASTSRVPRANVMILTGYGESAETWFETVGNLTDQGYAVWVLERAGQGGSQRYVPPRDLGHTPSFDPDIAAAKAMVRQVVRRRSGVPVVLLGYADGAVVTLRAVEEGLQVDGMILVSLPSIMETPLASAGLLGRFVGADRRPPLGWRPWSRSTPDDRAHGLTHDSWRGAVNKAWQTANPDLRMSAPSAGWRAALVEANGAARRVAGRIRNPLLITAAAPAEQRDRALCQAISGCVLITLPGAGPALHLEDDRWRAPWLVAVLGFIEARADAARAVGNRRGTDHQR